MIEHRARVWRACAVRDDTSFYPWRARCSCATNPVIPSWTARNHADALAVADHHVRQPRSDDWLNLDLRPPERRWTWQRPPCQRDYRLVEGP